jgi:hypothetical protein
MSDADRIVVAITALGTPVDDTALPFGSAASPGQARLLETEATALAGQLGITPYEARMKLTAGLPAIVLSTTDPAAAGALVTGLRQRGHRAQACATADVVAASAMVSLRRSGPRERLKAAHQISRPARGAEDQVDALPLLGDELRRGIA